VKSINRILEKEDLEKRATNKDVATKRRNLYECVLRLNCYRDWLLQPQSVLLGYYNLYLSVDFISMFFISSNKQP
jgi:hypothetical protein